MKLGQSQQRNLNEAYWNIFNNVSRKAVNFPVGGTDIWDQISISMEIFEVWI